MSTCSNNGIVLPGFDMGGHDCADAARRAEEAAERAEAAASHGPIIGLDGMWMLWDPSLEQYVSTGVSATGADSVARGDIATLQTDVGALQLDLAAEVLARQGGDNSISTYMTGNFLKNNANTTEEGHALDARMGKSLADSISSSINSTAYVNDITAASEEAFLTALSTAITQDATAPATVFKTAWASHGYAFGLIAKYSSSNIRVWYYYDNGIKVAYYNGSTWNIKSASVT